MSTRPAYSSDEEWCILSDNEDFVRRSSDVDDDIEPEPELVPVYTSAAPGTKKPTRDVASGGDDASLKSEEVLLLLDEALPSQERVDRRAATYSREVRLSLLSTEHRSRIQGVATDAHAPEYDTSADRTSVKVAFEPLGPISTKKCSYPERLRSTASSFRDDSAVVKPISPAFTPVESFAREQATQTETQTLTDSATQHAVVDPSRVGLFRAALERSFALTAQLHNKGQECERLSLRVMELQRRLEDASARQHVDEKLQSYQSSLSIANERLTLGLEYQGRLRGEIADLSDENESLKRQNAILSGQENDLSDQNALKLEAIEDALALAMTNVRAALRTKYRDAISKAQAVNIGNYQSATDKQEEEAELCVVCLTQLATVKSMPCGHRVLCPACAVRVDSCPVDRLPIKDKALTFGLNAYSRS